MGSPVLGAAYFSPTGTTKRIVQCVAGSMFEAIPEGRSRNDFDFTLPGARERSLSFGRQDIVVFGVPVYAGRVPRLLLECMRAIRGNGAIAIAVVVYGNRDYEDALLELSDLLESQGFVVVAAGAFIGEHSFSRDLAKGRPDATDLSLAAEFAIQSVRKITGAGRPAKVIVKGNRPYVTHHALRNERGELIDASKIRPKTSTACTDCKICAEACPTGAILHEDVSSVMGLCLRCNACVKACPTGAKYFDDVDYLRRKRELEINFSKRKDPEFFL